MFKGMTIASTMFGLFLLTLMATGIQIPTFSVFAQDSEIESVNASNSGSSNTTSSPESDIESVNAVGSEHQMLQAVKHQMLQAVKLLMLPAWQKQHKQNLMQLQLQ